MLRLTDQLELKSCPYCGVDTPSLHMSWHANTTAYNGENKRFWKTYTFARCGGRVLAASNKQDGEITEIYPDVTAVDPEIPDPARSYLQQAIDSLHAPAGSVMLSASAVDAMLKAKSYKDG